MQGFGPHLMLDGYGCDGRRLEDIDHVYKMLDQIPAEIGMTKIMPPYVFRYNGEKEEDWGVSGFVLIAESHISIHTYPEKRYLSADILSCKDFDAVRATQLIRDHFGIERVERNLLDRGTEFPKDIARAARLVRGDRQRSMNDHSLSEPIPNGIGKRVSPV